MAGQLIRPDLVPATAIRTDRHKPLFAVGRQRQRSYTGSTRLLGGKPPTQISSSVLMPLGEPFQVQQLPSSHDQIAHGQPGGRPAACSHDDLEQQARRVVILGHEDVGHEGAHNAARQLIHWANRDDLTQLAPASGREPFSDLRLWESHQLAR